MAVRPAVMSGLEKVALTERDIEISSKILVKINIKKLLTFLINNA